MEHLAGELHARRVQGVVLWEREGGGEDTAFEGCLFGSADQTFPLEQVVLVHGAGGDAGRAVGGKQFVLMQEAALGGGGHGSS